MLEKFLKDSAVSLPGNTIQINVVVYGSPLGIPARFFAGLIPAVLLAKKFRSMGKEVILRAFCSIHIATFCNGWQGDLAAVQNRKAINFAEWFFDRHNISFFIDYSCQVSDEMKTILGHLEAAIKEEPTLQGVVGKLQGSGFRYGGEVGRERSILYAAAHPFGWQDLWHPSVWLKKPDENTAVVNVMSESEKSFSMVRKFLVDRFSEYRLPRVNDVLTKTCQVPHYILFPGEPTMEDLQRKGIAACVQRYGRMLELASSDSERTMVQKLLKDFVSVCEFLAETNTNDWIDANYVHSFEIRERECILLLREIEATIVPIGSGWHATISCVEIGLHGKLQLYATLRGRLIAYDGAEGSIRRMRFQDIAKEA